MRLVPVAPYGYRIDGGRAVPELREQEVIAIVRDGRVRGVSFQRLAEELTARGYTTRESKPFYKSAVFVIAKALDEEGSAAA